jgi:hypothetical protein
MKKLSNEQKLEVMAEVPGVLRKLAAERDQYRDELIKIAKHKRVEKLAAQMAEKGLESGTVEEIADRLEKSAQEDESFDLNATEKAVGMAGPNMLQKRASVSDEPGSVGNSALERFVMS